MPTYEYRCQDCGHLLEVMQKISADPLKICPECGKEELMRGPGGGAGLHFTGTGFYITDYKNDSKPAACQSGNKGGCCPCKASDS